MHLRSARDALDAGIGMVHQELSIVPDLTVAENVFLGAQPLTPAGTVDWARMNARGEAAHCQPRPRHRPEDAHGQRCRSACSSWWNCRACCFPGAQIIILDEPTSALSPPEVTRLFDVLRQLRAEGRSIVFISHFLDDVLAISDRVTVFRNGRKVVTEAAADARPRTRSSRT